MKKLKLFLTSLALMFSAGSFAQDAESTKSPFSIVNIEQYGHSDGHKQEGWGPFRKKVFIGTNIYKAKMRVTNNGKTVFINIMYSIQNSNESSGAENKENPFEIIVGEQIKSNDESSPYLVGTGQIEVEKVEAIGLSKARFEEILKLHFTKITYI